MHKFVYFNQCLPSSFNNYFKLNFFFNCTNIKVIVQIGNNNKNIHSNSDRDHERITNMFTTKAKKKENGRR